MASEVSSTNHRRAGVGILAVRLILLACVLVQLAHPQGGSWRTYSTNDGLVNNIVRKLFQDSKGYLWIGTQGGVSRFDGEEFKNLFLKDSIASGDVISIVEDNAGNIWFQTGTGVKLFDGIAVRGITTKDGLPDNNISAMLKDHRGRIWLSTRKGLCRWDGNAIVRFSEKESAGNRQIAFFRQDSRRRIWASFKSGGLAYMEEADTAHPSWKSFSVPEGLPSDIVQDLQEHQSGLIWVATNGGLARFEGNGFSSASFNSNLPIKIVYSIAFDQTGALWFRLAGRGVARWDGTQLQTYTQAEGIAGNFVNDMMADHQGNLWLITNAGVTKMEKGVIQNFRKEHGLVSDFVKLVYQDREGGLWFGTPLGLTHFVEAQFRTYLNEDIEAVPKYRPFAFRDRRKRLWFPCSQGLAFTDGIEFRIFTRKDGLLDPSVNGITENESGQLVIRLRNGLQLFDKGKFTTLNDALVKGQTFVNGTRDIRGNTWFVRNDNKIVLLKNGTFSLFEKGAFATSRFNFDDVAIDSVGNVWFLTSGGPIRANENDARFFRLSEIGQGINSYVSHTETWDGTAWFATKQGLIRDDGTAFKKMGTEDGMPEGEVLTIFPGRGRFFYPILRRTDADGRDVPLGVVRTDGVSFRLFTTADGLPSNDVRNVYEEPTGIVWFMTDRGIGRYDGKGIKLYASAFSVAGADWGFSMSDSSGNVWMASNAGLGKFNGRYFTSYSTKNGLLSNEVIRLSLDPLNQLWIRTSKGIQKYVPRDIVPSINIATVTAGATTYAADSSREFSHRDNNLVFDYRGINFSTGPEMLQYVYRLHGYDTTWYGPLKERKVTYHNLSPGEYRFQVKALNVDLGESVTAAEYAFVITPPFYVTWWFRITTFLTLATAGTVTYRRRMRAKFERERVLNELRAAHDMQMGLMPATDPVVNGFDVSGMCKPATEVGGDYYDYIWLDDEQRTFGIAIADVSGKAMKAAITAVMTSGMVYREIGSNNTPKSIMSNINRPMYYKTDKRVFTAMLFASIDVETRMFRFSNAGQTSPALKRGGDVQYLKMEGVRLPLGMKERVEYGEMEVQLHSGDVLVFCTDGFTEQMNEAEEVFGMYRLAETIAMLDDGLSSRDMVARLFDEAQRYAGKATQHDDMTVVVVRVL